MPRLWVSRSFLRGICQELAVPRSISSENQVWVGQYGATNRTCPSSSLILYSVSLGGTHTCEGPVASWVPLCPYRVFPRSGSKTTGNERSLKMQKVYLIESVMSPNQLDHLGMDSPGLVAEVRSRTTFQSEKLNMRCTCCLLIPTLWSAAAECNNRMPMCIGLFSYTQSGLVSLREIPIRRSPDVSQSDRLKGISELLKWCSNLPKYSMISIWTEIRFF